MKLVVTHSTVPVEWWCTENCSACPHHAGPDEMRPEYDIRGGVRGKYYGLYRQDNPPSWWQQILEIFRNWGLVGISRGK